MKIATWNVNSVRSRLERLLAWLQKAQPDILCLQELKATDEAFPYEPIQQAGYHAAVFGQKTYNGVAILSRREAVNVQRGVDDRIEDLQARFLAAQVGSVHVITVYVPNGQVVGTEAYKYKLQWFKRLRAFLESRFTPATPLVVCGDLNVARDEKDVAHPAKWAQSVLFDGGSRQALEHLLAWGLEPRITAVFRDALIEAYDVAGRKWFITLEDPITDPTFGTELGRNDLRIYPQNHCRQTVFFVVECKRLRVTSDSGFKHLADKYVEDGMQRFVDGRYACSLPYGGMLGYVMDNRLDDAFAKVQEEIEAQRTKLKIETEHSLRTPSSTLPDYRWSADSVHERVGDKLCLHHLLVAVSADLPVAERKEEIKWAGTYTG